MINIDNVTLSKTTVGINETLKIEVMANEVLPTWADHKKQTWNTFKSMTWDKLKHIILGG